MAVVAERFIFGFAATATHLVVPDQFPGRPE
jgi:hypothetical protein